jgi:hypothetical protein
MSGVAGAAGVLGVGDFITLSLGTVSSKNYHEGIVLYYTVRFNCVQVVVF